MEDNTMSYESGGRADKYGNHYENCYLVILLLRLIREATYWSKDGR